MSAIASVVVESKAYTVELPGATPKLVTVSVAREVSVVISGGRGPKGETGDSGSGGVGLFVQPADPGLTEPGLWMQTGLGAGGTDMTLWVEDGS